MVSRLIKTFGPLRLVLLTVVVLAIILRPEPGVRLEHEGLEVIPNLLAPVLTPIFFMLLLLDAMMAMVYRSDKTDQVRRDYLLIVLTNLILAVTLIVYWAPFYIGISETL